MQAWLYIGYSAASRACCPSPWYPAWPSATSSEKFLLLFSKSRFFALFTAAPTFRAKLVYSDVRGWRGRKTKYRMSGGMKDRTSRAALARA